MTASGEASRGSRANAPHYQAPIAIVVTWVAGFVDAVGYLALYHLYTANMSGNSVGVGIQIASGAWGQVLRHGWPVLMFAVGLMMAASVLEGGNRNGVRAIVGWTLGLEVFLLAAFVALGSSMLEDGQLHAPGLWVFYGIVALPALAMGIQDATITRVGGLSVRTTHVTGSIVHFAAAASEYLYWLRDRTAGRIRHRLFKALRVSTRLACFRDTAVMASLWFAYVVGAVCGTEMKSIWQLKALTLPLAALALLIALDFLHPRRVSRVARGKPS